MCTRQLHQHRYHFNTGQLMLAVRSDVSKWADGSIVRAEMEQQIASLLGPKTEADLAPKVKEKKKKVRNPSLFITGISLCCCRVLLCGCLGMGVYALFYVETHMLFRSACKHGHMMTDQHDDLVIRSPMHQLHCHGCCTGEEAGHAQGNQWRGCSQGGGSCQQPILHLHQPRGKHRGALSG